MPLPIQGRRLVRHEQPNNGGGRERPDHGGGQAQAPGVPPPAPCRPGASVGGTGAGTAPRGPASRAEAGAEGRDQPPGAGGHAGSIGIIKVPPIVIMTMILLIVRPFVVVVVIAIAIAIFIIITIVLVIILQAGGYVFPCKIAGQPRASCSSAPERSVDAGLGDGNIPIPRAS